MSLEAARNFEGNIGAILTAAQPRYKPERE
jgi:hypothetical protein